MERYLPIVAISLSMWYALLWGAKTAMTHWASAGTMSF